MSKTTKQETRQDREAYLLKWHFLFRPNDFRKLEEVISLIYSGCRIVRVNSANGRLQTFCIPLFANSEVSEFDWSIHRSDSSSPTPIKTAEIKFDPLLETDRVFMGISAEHKIVAWDIKTGVLAQNSEFLEWERACHALKESWKEIFGDD